MTYQWSYLLSVPDFSAALVVTPPPARTHPISFSWAEGFPLLQVMKTIGSISENSSKRSSLPRNYSNSSSLGSTPSTSELSLSSRQSREDTERGWELRQRKSQLQHRNNSGSMEDRESVDSLGASSSIFLGGTEQARMKRQHLLRMATMSDRSLERQFNSYSSRPELPRHSSDEGIHHQKDMAPSEHEEAAEDRGSSLISNEEDSSLKSEAGSTRRVDKTTGITEFLLPWVLVQGRRDWSVYLKDSTFSHCCISQALQF